jgi:hypothetical protein
MDPSHAVGEPFTEKDAGRRLTVSRQERRIHAFFLEDCPDSPAKRIVAYPADEAGTVTKPAQADADVGFRTCDIQD